MTSGWTSQHTQVAVLVAISASACLLGLLDTSDVAVWVGVAVAVTAVASLATDAFGGFVVGLASTAALVAARRALGPWGPDAFWLTFGQTLALLAVGVAGGSAGVRLRARAEQGPSLLPAPVFGSLGLLDADVAMGRLEEEVERAREHRRPLTLVILETELVGDDTGVDRGALRAVARIFEGRLRDGDVPFALGEDRLGAVLPESTAQSAWDRLGQIMDAVSDGRYSRRDEEGTTSLCDDVVIHVGVAELDAGTAGADDLLDVATAAIDRSRSRVSSVEEERVS